MRWFRLLGWALGYSAAAYVVDVPLRRDSAARAALAYAKQRNRPLLNIGAGTEASALFGAHFVPGAFNVDVCGVRQPPSTSRVTYADAQSLADFETGSIGAVLASHVLEHLPNPEAALKEWLRVVGGDEKALFIVVPSWWAPHTWLHPGHLWYVTGSDGRLAFKRLREVNAAMAPCRFRG